MRKETVQVGLFHPAALSYGEEVSDLTVFSLPQYAAVLALILFLFLL